MKKPTSRIGIFVWDPDASLRNSIDLDSLLNRCRSLKNVVCCEQAEALPGSDVPEMPVRDVGDERPDRIIWVGHIDESRYQQIRQTLSRSGVNPYLQILCDLKAQGVCSPSLDPNVRARKAATLLKMAVARARLLEPLEPLSLPGIDTALVIGAGVAGLHASLSLLNMGFGVHLIERDSGVGGKTALLERFYPKICDPRCGLDFVCRQLIRSERLSLHTLTTIAKLEGAPGAFTATVFQQPRFVDSARCDGCGICQDVCPIRISGHSRYFQDEAPFPTSTGLSALAKDACKAIHPAMPMRIPTAFVIERDCCPENCDACRTACPNGAIEFEQEPREKTLDAGAVLVTTGWDPYPLSRLTEFGYGIHTRVIGNLEMEKLLKTSTVNDFKHVAFIQCAGSRDNRHLPYCSSVCCSATLKQIRYLKEQSPETTCTVFYQDIRTPGFEEDLYREVRSLEKVTFVRGLPSGVRAQPSDGSLNLTAEDTFSGKPIRIEADLLVLAGGMAPSTQSTELARTLNLPSNQYGFFEAHHQCFPEESQRSGIYVGGCARDPMSVAQSIESSHLAAMKAVRFLREFVQVEPTYPVVDKGKCDQCKRCVEECPFSSFVFDEKQFPEPVLTRCRQCGNCMGVCPLGAISLRNRTVRQYAAAIEVLETSFMNAREEPLILAFLCENDAARAAEEANINGIPVPPNVIHMSVPCAGAVNNALIADALSLGIDGVLIGGCKDGQCHYVRGNQLVRKRSGDLQDKLKTMMIEPVRVRFESLEIRDSHKYAEVLKTFVQDLKAIGPNPFKI